jgi:hypothetical protein
MEYMRQGHFTFPFPRSFIICKRNTDALTKRHYRSPGCGQKQKFEIEPETLNCLWVFNLPQNRKMCF